MKEKLIKTVIKFKIVTTKPETVLCFIYINSQSKNTLSGDNKYYWIFLENIQRE